MTDHPEVVLMAVDADADPDVQLPDSPPAPTEPASWDAGLLLAELFDVQGGALTHAEAVAALRERWGGRFLNGPAACAWVNPFVVVHFLRRVGLGVRFDGRGWVQRG